MAVKYHSHKVLKGESLSSIGSLHNVSWNAIAIANNIKSPYTIRVGQYIKVPMTSGYRAAETINGKNVPKGTSGGATPSKPASGSSSSGSYGAAFNPEPILDKLIGGVLLYGIFRVLMKVF